MRIHLASLGWIKDRPTGNRLRWTYPMGEKDGADKFIGFPEVIIVERARLDEDIPEVKPIRTSAGIVHIPSVSTVPLTWWDEFGTVSLMGMLPLVYRLPGPVQAVSFTYHGASTRILVRDSEHDQIVADRMLADGDAFYLEASSMDEFIFFTFSADLELFSTLDLLKDRGLDWETIAEIRVSETWNSTYEEIQKRYDHPLSISLDEFEELRDLAHEAIRCTPTTIMADRPTPWQVIDVALSVRWEFALLCGYAFFDGPRSEENPIDTIRDLLENITSFPVAYRVRDKTGRIAKSNIVVCPPTYAEHLSIPSIPQYIDPIVRLIDKSTFEATLTLQWHQFDARAIGVEVEEEIGPSASIGSVAESHTFYNRSHRPEYPPFQGNVARSFTVPFYDVNLRARVRAHDGWDRVSIFSPWTVPTPLVLHHEPIPPSLDSAQFDDTGRVHVLRLKRYAAEDWQPDAVVKHAPGIVNLYRSRPGKNVRIEKVKVSTPVNVDGKVYKTSIIPTPVNSVEFEGGSIVAGQLKARITKISGANFFFEIPGDDDPITLFKEDTGTLQQDPKHDSLWMKVKDFPVDDLPIELQFDDPIKGPSGKADVVSCYTRISYLGRIGPPSNIVSALRLPLVPEVPPPFSVAILGIDFYNRTMIKIRFTDPVSSGMYSVWWADDALTIEQFALASVPGLYGGQTAYQNRILYDVLSLPVPRLKNRTVTIGVQQVNEGRGQSNFQIVQVTLKPPL